MFYYRYIVLYLLTITYILNFVDRQIIGIISPALKVDLQLTDWELGLLKGFAFAVLYSTLSLPIARLADRADRKVIVSSAVFIWSMFTFLSGLAANFIQLLLCRIGVGIGEAGGTAPSQALISDYFAENERATALSIFAFGVPIGVAMAYLLGGTIATQVSWRVALIVLGLFGIALTVLLAFVVEDPRASGNTTSETNQNKDINKANVLSVKDSIKTLVQDRAFVLITAAVTLSSFVTYSIGAWIVDFFVRSHPETSLSFILVALGLMNGLAYGLGTLLGGRIVDVLSRTNLAFFGYAPSIAVTISVPLFVLSLWSEPTWLSLVFWTGVHLLLGIYIGPSFALVQNRSRPEMRAFAAASFFFVINLIALGLGPTYIGTLSSLLTSSQGEVSSLQWAMTSLSIPLVLAALMFYRLGLTLKRETNNASPQTLVNES